MSDDYKSPRLWVDYTNSFNEYGIAGPLIFSLTSAIPASLFALLVLEMRTKAPGARTFAQIIYARFGPLAHIPFITIFVITNFQEIMLIIAAGTSALQAVTRDASNEVMILLIFIAIIPGAVVGGLEGLRVIFYFTTIIILGAANIIAFAVFNNSNNFPIVSTASFFTNQGYWQVGIYTSLDHSCLSFVLAVLLWFTIPFLYSMSCGIGYLALTSASHEHIITHHEVYEGLLPYVVPTYLFGHWGQIVVYTIIAISLVSSCICNLMGIRSLLVHDVLETYIMVDGNIPSAVFSAIGGPCIGSVVLPIYWARLHKSGLLLGLLGGPLIALLAWVTQAMTMEDELLTNLDSEKALFTASMTAFVAGFALPVLVTLGSTKPLANEETQIVWRRLQEIDNPLMPWPEVYSQELDLRYSLHLSEGKPALSEVQRALQFTKRVTQLGFCINFLCFSILCPALTMTSQILSFETLSIWITTIEIWAAAALFFCITLPVIFFTINYMENSKDESSSVLKKARQKQRLPYRRTGNWFSRLL
ncbi:unnamed protein product [Schistocephalus solidus]|uniref:AA_permease domain-containing protein n=1 Tax=Schistocephalus solidus TaxID=70667 RepID=A0A183T9Q8_SCHSO|nr:unnamed protein product [Schistocephalus solidus]